MAKHGKKYLAALAKVDIDKVYSAKESVALAKETSITKFDSTIEVHMRTTLDSRQSDQQLRDVVVYEKLLLTLAYFDIDRPSSFLNTATNRFGYDHRTLAFSLVTGAGFTDPPRTLLNYTPSAVAWADFDQDGDTDLITTMRDQLGFRHCYYYLNHGTGALALVEAGLPSVSGHLSVTDLDHDRLAGLCVAGGCGAPVSEPGDQRVCRNYEQPPGGRMEHGGLGRPR